MRSTTGWRVAQPPANSLTMLKTMNLTRTTTREARLEAECDTLLRELERGVKQMKKVETEIAELRVKKRAALARLKAA